MKKIAFTFLCILSITLLFAQKPVIDSLVFGKWPAVGAPAISNDGNYSIFTIFNQPVGCRTLILLNNENNWRVEERNVSNALITQDSRMVIFTKRKDSL